MQTFPKYRVEFPKYRVERMSMFNLLCIDISYTLWNKDNNMDRKIYSIWQWERSGEKEYYYVKSYHGSREKKAI